VIAGAVALGLAAPGGALAVQPAPSGDLELGGGERHHLQEVRDRLERRQALQSALRNRTRMLAAEVEALRARQRMAAAALASNRQRQRALEQRLDRLVPRLLAREAEVRKLRAQTAHALAELASNGRSDRLGSTERARMLAISELMLERLRRIEAGLQALRDLPERMIERHARVAGSLPGLAAAQRRLAAELERTAKSEQVVLARLRALEPEVRLLANDEAGLARRLRRVEIAIAARAEPREDEPALANPAGTRSARRPRAAVAKAALGAEPALAVEAGQRAVSELLAAAATSGNAAARASAEGVAGWPIMPPPGAPATAALRSEGGRNWPGASHDALSRSALAVAFEPGRRAFGQDGRPIRSGRRSPPLLPVPEELAGLGLPAQGRPDLQVSAAPGQGVATPVDGKVVFAGQFKSYGLLLIIEHEREYHTLLWGFARLDVSLGEAVRFGQIVGTMGARGDDAPVLHVERRRNGRPINLAANSSGIQG
jgi:murein hydrolase activator